MNDIYITNTLTRKKELLKPIAPGSIKMYACGVTVYDHCHIGHAVQAIYFDTIRNYLEYAGFEVTYVRNYTDVDDKIINRARESGISPAKLAQDMIDSAQADMKAIGCRPATHEPRVSQMIPLIISMIETLISKNAAYVTNTGDVYYRVRQKADYGKLSGQRPDDMLAGTREIVQGEKEDSLDFALWKIDDVPEASWDSPWGRGRPGWHIECSVMAKKFLGDTFDIHGGGRDLKFPHHENEIAQSESANGTQLCNYWIHNGLLTINKQKMSKSLGNHLLIKDFLKNYPAEVLRLNVLQQHYSTDSDFSKASFLLAHRRLFYYYKTLAGLDELAAKALNQNQAALLDGFSTNELIEKFHQGMCDDFNTCVALGEINKVFKKANELLVAKKEKAQPEKKFATAKALAAGIREVMGVFGLLKEDSGPFLENLKVMILPELGITKQHIENLMQQRNDSRKNKNFEEADKIRRDLLGKGIEIMDTPTGTVWGIRYTE